MNFNRIDKARWKRKEIFEHYLNKVRCGYSMTAEIEITELMNEIKDRKLKSFPVQVYMISTLVNRYQEFRMCFNAEGELGYWDEMSPSYTVFHKETELFSCLWTRYNPSFEQFYMDYQEDMEQYGDREGFNPKPGEPQNIFPVSSIPWVSFKGFNLNLYTEGAYLLPIFTTGQYYEQDGKILLPLSIQVHHAVCDGFHISRFINDFQSMAENYEDWL